MIYIILGFFLGLFSVILVFLAFLIIATKIAQDEADLEESK